MLKKYLYRLVILMIGITVIFIMTGCHATQSGYIYDENYPYPYPANYYPYYYPYPYFYPHVFFGSDILIIQSNRDGSGQSTDEGIGGRVLRSGPSGSGGRSLSSNSSTGKRSLER